MNDLFDEDENNLEAYLQIVIENKAIKKDLEAQVKKAKQNLQLSCDALISAMKDQGTTSIRALNHVASYSSIDKISVKNEHKETQFKWLREIGSEGMIIEKVESSTFQSFINDIWEDEPPEWVTVFPMDKMSITKSRKKK